MVPSVLFGGDEFHARFFRRVESAVGAAQLDVVMALNMSFPLFVRNALAAIAVFVAIICPGPAWSGTSD